MTENEKIVANFKKSVDKLKYIFLTTVPQAKLFDIKQWVGDDIWDTGYSLDITYDYSGPDDDEIERFGDSIRNSCMMITNCLEKFPINAKGTLDSNKEIYLRCSIFKVDYSFDEKCIITISLNGYFDEY